MNASTETSPETFETVAIVGVGLIGGSIAAALKSRRLVKTVIGVGRSGPRLEEARQRGLLDQVLTDPADAAARADLMVFCTPVDRIAEGVRAAAAQSRPGSILTDAGSIKGAICRDLETGLPPGVTFVGSHPLAGSEKQGFEFADACLFEGRTCVITPSEKTPRPIVERVRQFWRGLGARVLEMSAEKHDQALAETSHLPHLIAAALATVLSVENRPLVASGFRDTTRIASGDPDLWEAILSSNAAEVLRCLNQYEQVLQRFRQALETRDAPLLESLLTTAKTNRDATFGS